MPHVRSIVMTELEAWAIEDMIRHTWSEEGRPIGKMMLLKLFALIGEFDLRRDETSPPSDLPLILAEEELWAIDFHIRRGHLDPSGVRVGRELLMKVFEGLLDIRNSEEMKRLRFPEAEEVSNPESERRLRELRDQYRRSEENPKSDLPDPP